MKARELAQLLSSQLLSSAPFDERPSPEEVAVFVEAKIAKLGLPRPVAVGDEPEDAEEDPRELLYWLLKMAVPTYERLLRPLPAVDASLLRRFEELLRDRPRDDGEHAQMSIDSASTLRRALVAKRYVERRPGPVVAIGDDDAVTLALALLGVDELVAFDIDERVLGFLEDKGRLLGRRIETARLDVFEAPTSSAGGVPEGLEGRCSVAITDPIRSEDACLAFVDVGLECLVPGGTLLWADHPDWNFELGAVHAALAEQGHGLLETHTALHEYPLTSTWIEDLDGKAHRLGVSPDWLRRLASAVSGWSHLFVVSRRS